MGAQKSINSFCFITATYGADKEHFALLRQSIACSKFKHIEHKCVIQSEDIAAFEQHNGWPMQCISSADLLPQSLELQRIKAARLAGQCGPNLTKLLGSLARRFYFPRWPHFTGWHTQQISKLMLAASCQTDYAVIVDSDVLVTPNATLPELEDRNNLVCFSHTVEQSAVQGKVANWNRSAVDLFDTGNREEASIAEKYFDTPFIIHVPTLNAMFKWLEAKYAMPWWQAMLQQAPRRWSEFQCYRTFLRHHYHGDKQVVYKNPTTHKYLFDTSDSAQVVACVDQWLDDPSTHFITLHSHSAGRKNIKPNFIKGIVALFKKLPSSQ